MEFLCFFLRSLLAGKPKVASRNVGCFLTLSVVNFKLQINTLFSQADLILSTYHAHPQLRQIGLDLDFVEERLYFCVLGGPGGLGIW